MSRMNRRRFTWVATSGIASAALVACGGDAVDDDLTPTRISEVEGAPPTLAPNATPFSSDTGDGGGEAAAAADTGTGGGGMETITVTGLDSLAYDPASFEVAPGQTIHFVNGGVLDHDMNIDELGWDGEVVGGGGEYEFTVPDDAEIGAEYAYYCSVPGHREGGMEGTVTIVEASAGGGEEQAAAEEGGEEAAAGGGAAGPIEVQALDSLAFDPSEIEAAPGQEIHVVNAGALQHDFVVDEIDLATDLLNGGEEQTIVVPEDAEVGQSYTFYCSVPGHRQAGMEGTLTIVEAGAGGEAAAAATEEEAPAEGEEAAAAAEGGAAEPITVNALDALQFDPNEFEASPGQEILVVNTGAMQHDFVIDELEMATDMLNGGEEQTLTVPEDAEVGQSYTFYCSVPGHRQAGMEGTMTIVEGGGGAAAASAEGEAAEAEPAAAASTEPVDPSQPVEVVALDSLTYDPAQISVARGQAIRVRNDGTLQHDFVVDEWGLATALLNTGEEDELIVPDNAEIGASYAYYCSVPGHRAAGMEGTLTIVEAAGAAAEGEGEATAEATEEAPATEAAAAGGEVEVADDAIRVATLDSMRFAPSQFSAAPGQQIHLVNPGVLIHDIVVDEWELDSGAIAGGEETVVTIPEDAEVGSEVTFYCSVPGHRESGMEGTITIVEADVAQAAAVTPAADATPAGATPAAESATPAAESATPAAESATPAASPVAAGGGGGDTVEVTCVDIAYEPTELTIPADTDVEIHVVNEGMLEHDFNIEDTDFATAILPGASGAEETLTVNLPAGEYVYFCSVPGHRQAGMEGTLTVE